jgi:hypothetical protein
MAKIAKRENPQREQRATRLSRASLFPLSVMEGIDQCPLTHRDPQDASRGCLHRAPLLPHVRNGSAAIPERQWPNPSKGEQHPSASSRAGGVRRAAVSERP